MVKVTDSSHEYEPCTVEDPPCRGDRCTSKMLSAPLKILPLVWCDVKVRRGRVPAQVSSSSIDHGSKLQGASLNALE
ncbi:hypothetical protein TNCV_3176831 [Trichonephila clavipes]|nr:hypothetical protein TNCV_3176831 [Trichonephila clavipes]